MAPHPADVASARKPSGEQALLSVAVIDSLNLSLVPPEATPDANSNDGPPHADDDGGAELLKSLTRGWEKRRELKLSRAGIRYDATTALYKTPLGLPCDPREHPMICQKDEEEVSTTTRLPLGVKLRRRRRDIADDYRGDYEEPKRTADWNPFVDGPKSDMSPTPSDTDSEAEFLEEEVLSPGRRRRRAEW